MRTAKEAKRRFVLRGWLLSEPSQRSRSDVPAPRSALADSLEAQVEAYCAEPICAPSLASQRSLPLPFVLSSLCPLLFKLRALWSRAARALASVHLNTSIYHIHFLLLFSSVISQSPLPSLSLRQFSL